MGGRTANSGTTTAHLSSGLSGWLCKNAIETSIMNKGVRNMRDVESFNFKDER